MFGDNGGGAARNIADDNTGIRRSLPMIMEQIESKAKSLRVWLQTHGDEDFGQQPVLLTDGGTRSEAEADLGTVVFEGGGDPPEHHLNGIENLADMVPWTDDPQKARGALIAFLTAETKPSSSGRTPAEIGRDLNERGMLLYLVCQPTPSLNELCDAAGGLMFQITNSPSRSEMQRIAAQLSASILQMAAKSNTVPLA